MTDNDFKIRTYGISELAMLYCPELTASGALKKFHFWIDTNPRLHESLGFAQGRHRGRSLTPREVRLVVAELGEPKDKC